MMCKNTMLYVLAAATVFTAVNAQAVDSTGGQVWMKVADGVYETTSKEGVVTRMAYGTEGIEHDRRILSTKLEEMRKNTNIGNDVQVDEIVKLEDAIKALSSSGRSASSKSLPITPSSTTSGTMCTWVQYGLDSHLSAGWAGASAISRAGWYYAGPGPMVPPSSVSLYSSATVTPSSGSPVTKSYSSSTASDNMLPTAIADWSRSNSYSGSCTASTYSYVYAVFPAAACNGLTTTTGFVSKSVSYPNCVSAL